MTLLRQNVDHRQALDMRQGLDPAAALWVGWHSFELLGGQPGSLVTVDLRAGRDDVQMTVNDMLLTFIDRDDFREWLTYPAPEALARDHLAWSVHAGITYLTLGEDGEYGTYAVPAPTITYLTEVI